MPSVLDRLNSFLDRNSPKLASFLHHMWRNQQQAVTYKELREAVENGELDLHYLVEWQQDYNRFITEAYAPLAAAAIAEYIDGLNERYNGHILDPTSSAIDRFISDRGANLVREISIDQHDAINTLVRQAAMSGTMTVDQLAHAIRPCIGLTRRQALSGYHLYTDLIDQGIDPAKAQRRQTLYTEMVHRRRAATIAQTELAFAYNAGAEEVIRQAIENNEILPTVSKKWSTAADERVCKKCGSISGQTVPLDAPFSNGVLEPPAHPLCRCAVLYEDLQSPSTPSAPPEQVESPKHTTDEGAPIQQHQQQQQQQATQVNTPQPQQPVQIPQPTTLPPQVDVGGSFNGYTKAQQNDLRNLIEAAPQDVRDFYNRYGPDLKEPNPYHPKGPAYYDPADRQVHFATTFGANGDNYHPPYTVHFHEYGHNMDAIASAYMGYYSEIWQDASNGNKTIDEIIDEDLIDLFMDRLFDKSKKRYLHDLRVQSKVWLGGIGVQPYLSSLMQLSRGYTGMSRQDPTYQALLSEARMVRQNRGAAEKFIEKHLAFFRQSLYYNAMEAPGVHWMLDEFLQELSATYPTIETANLSDILEGWDPFIRNNISGPIGNIGHGPKYFRDINYRHKRRCTEAFAEFSSAYIADHKSLAILQKYLPKTSKAYLKLCKEASMR